MDLLPGPHLEFYKSLTLYFLACIESVKDIEDLRQPETIVSLRVKEAQQRIRGQQEPLG